MTLNRSVKLILRVFIPPLLLVTAIVAQTRFDPMLAFHDPTTAVLIAGRCCNSYFGFMSNLGVVIWVVAASACGSAAFVLAAASAPARDVAFLTYAAVLTGLLGLDDLFMLHERLLPDLGVPQDAVLAFYGLAAIAYVAMFFREITRRDVLIFALGLLALATSVGIDVIEPDNGEAPRFFDILEDSAKFLGIAGWAGFHILRAVHAMTTAVAAADMSRRGKSG